MSRASFQNQNNFYSMENSEDDDYNWQSRDTLPSQSNPYFGAKAKSVVSSSRSNSYKKSSHDDSDSDDSVDVVIRPIDKRKSFQSSNNNVLRDSDRSSPTTRDNDDYDRSSQRKFVPRSSKNNDSWASEKQYRNSHPRSRLDESDLLPTDIYSGKENNRKDKYDNEWNTARPKKSNELTKNSSKFDSKMETQTVTSSPDYSDDAPDHQNTSYQEDVEVDLYAIYAKPSRAESNKQPTSTNNNATSQEHEDEPEFHYNTSKYVIPPNDDVSDVDVKGSVSSVGPALNSYSQRVFNGKYSFVQIAHERDIKSEHVQCVINRVQSTLGLITSTTYELILQDCNKTLLIAQKKTLNRTSNYHMFDMTRGQVGSKLSKKNGNYIGKLRAKNMARTEYIVANHNNSQREELAGIMYYRRSIAEQLAEGSQPREMLVVVPPLDEDNVPIPYLAKETDDIITSSDDPPSLIDCYTFGKVPEGYTKLQSKEPILDNGCYRLDFRGRVSVASVKNFQLISPDKPDNLICQFGKVGENQFHLDYKAPLNAIQAFSLALTQFNL